MTTVHSAAGHRPTQELLRELGQFPLLEAIFGRRARRFGLGMTVPDGPLAFQSKHAPVPLSDTERLLLVLVGAGISGWNFGLPHTPTGAPDTGCNYPMRSIGRTYPSAAGIHASELLWTDDCGSYITQFRELNPDAQQELADASDLDALLEKAQRHIVRLSSSRAALPKEFPHVESHNFWVANQPGTTLFIPIVDLTQQVLDGLAILLGERAVPFDAANDRPCGNLDRFVKSGLLEGDRRVPLVDFEQYLLSTAAAEVTTLNYNIVLVLQAMGLGGWLYSGINPTSLLGGFAADGVPGFGFRFTTREDWSGPNPVGLDNYFEGYCPPYRRDMREAVAALVARKFGPGGTYDPATPGPYKDNAAVKGRIHRYTPEFIDCLGEVAQYIHDTYGKFPATVPSIYARLYAQAHHLDLEFYDQHFSSEAYLDTHREHMAKWH
ncbi:MAG: hypothetical protein HYX69_11220 [Planctomycetia bacterium]|nr:hypothetical protein [Planctomycetia bacterium]